MQPKPTPTISLCMIVKDEERRLSRCLESVRGLVDEIVVVDTGSRDRTVEIARSYGAAVHFFSWIDDFSAARNESLRHAAGEWIFYLDADERLNRMGEEDCLRKAASSPQADAFSTLILSLQGSSEKVELDNTHNIRLFRNYPGIHFVNEVHERVEPFLARAGARIARSAFTIEHFAYEGSQDDMERRLRRNLDLSMKHLERDPDDAYGLYYLGLTYLSLEKHPESREALEKALSAKDLHASLRAIILNLLSFLHLSLGENDQALQRARGSLAAVPHQTTAHLLTGLALFRRERYGDALPHLLHAHRQSDTPPGARRSGLSQEFDFIDRLDLAKAIATCYAETSQFDQAIPFFQLYLASRGREAETLRRLGICFLNIRDYRRAVEFLEQAEKMGANRSELAIPMAYALARIDDVDGAEEYLDGGEPEAGRDIQRVDEIRRLIREAGRRRDTCPKTSGPLVSLCMIVKNEEKHLAGCLDSVARLVDEIVIVDTGSNDRTVEIARTFGARVHFFPWRDDFSAARNESLRHATGEWILYLDGDERLRCKGKEDCLRAAASVQGVDAYSVPIIESRPGGEGMDSCIAYATRMFRNRSGLHFTGRAHETVDIYLRKTGANVFRAGFIIEHLGYSVEQSEMDRKYHRNLALLRKDLEESPQDRFSLYHTGLTLLGLQRVEECRAVLEQASRLEGSDPCLEAMTLNAMAYCDLKSGRFPEALRGAEESLALIPSQYTARLMAGLAHYHLGEYESARPHLLEAHRFIELPPERRRTSIHYEDSIEKGELLKAIAVCCSETHRYAEALAFLRRLLEHKGEDADLLSRLGLCCLNVEDFAPAVPYLERALELGADRAGLALPLAFACFRIGEFDKAHGYFVESSAASPRDISVSMKLLCMMAGTDDYAPRLPETWQGKKSIARRASREQSAQLAMALASSSTFHAEPLAELLQMSSLDTEDTGPLLRDIVTACFQRGRIAELCALLENLLAKHPSHPILLEALGIARIKAGDFPGAIDVHLALHALFPDAAEIERRLVGLYAKTGKMDSALAHLARK